METSRKENRVFCQIATKDITWRNCLRTQGSKECFGCAAPSRRCELCWHNTVDVPAVGMCSSCLTKELEEEQEVGKTNKRVRCALAKTSISLLTCGNMQDNKNCKGCKESSRACEKCRKNTVRFLRYGLCLSCAVSEFGEGWKPPEKEKSDKIEEKLAAKDTQIAMRPVEPSKPAENQDTKKQLCLGCGNNPVKIEKWRLCNTCVSKFRSKRRHLLAQEKKDSVDDLTEAVKEVILSYGISHPKVLQKHFNITGKKLKSIMDQLEKEGVVGPYRGRSEREILVPLQDFVIKNILESRQAQPFTLALQQKIRKLEQIASIVGKDNDLGQLCMDVIACLESLLDDVPYKLLFIRLVSILDEMES